jgi:propionyl-CoA carboxylase alpha chain
MFYDPMIAKLITYGPTRDAAIGHMREALDEYYIRGLSHNIPFLASLMSKERFVKANLTTGFIAEEYPHGFHAADLPAEDPTVLVATAAAVKRRITERNIQVSGQFPGHEMKAPEELTVVLGGQYHDIAIRPAQGGYAVVIGNEAISVKTDWEIGQPLFRGTIDGRPVCVQVDRLGISYMLAHSGSRAEALVLTREAAALHRLMPHKAPPDMSKYLLSPMPGLLRSVEVTEGQEIKAGEPLAVVEAMKMENILKAERDGVVAKVHAKAGESLAVDQKIIEFAS